MKGTSMESDVFDGEIYDGNVDGVNLPIQSFPMMPMQMGGGMVQSRTPYVSAMQVLKPRKIDDVERSILRQAVLLGEEAFYGWGSGKGRVEGGSIDLAMTMINAYGNAVIVPDSVQETSEAWIFTHVFVDLETGVSTPRQWRESKRSIVDGNFDKERKDTIRFGRGQSKNIRNAILRAMPKWLVNKAIEEAKRGARDKMEKFIRDKGLAAAQSYTLQQLKRYGVNDEQILEKMGKAKINGLDIDDLVRLSADFRSIESGQEHASTLFPPKEQIQKTDIKDKLRLKVEATRSADVTTEVKPEDLDVNQLNKMTVRLGIEPMTWLVKDDKNDEYLVSHDQNDFYACTCTTPPSGSCLHVIAVQRFISQS
jgi:hypothetical protein